MSDPSFPNYVRRGIEMAGVTGEGAITRFAVSPSGAHRRSVSFGDGRTLLVEPVGADESVDSLARLVAVLPKWALALCDEVDQLRAELDRAAPKPRNLLGDGCVRAAPDGALWLLSCPEKGWSAFGFRVADWDELFRRFNVRCGAPQEDKTGVFWPVSPIELQAKPSFGLPEIDF